MLHPKLIRLILHDAIYGSLQEHRLGVQQAAQENSSERRVMNAERIRLIGVLESAREESSGPRVWFGVPRRGTRTRSHYGRRCGRRRLSKTSRRRILENVT